MEIEESLPSPQPEAWVYKPTEAENPELIDACMKNLTPTQPPDEMQVTLQGQDGNMMPNLTLMATEQSLRLQNAGVDIPFGNIRYVTTDCAILCSDPEQADRFVVMVSMRRPETPECDIFNMYIKPDTAETALAVLNFLHFHIFRYLKSVTNSEDPTVIQQYIRPLVRTEMQVQVHWRTEQKTWKDEKRFIVVDQECVALYTKPFQEQPTDVMFFWEEQHKMSAAKVSYIKSADCIFLQSPQMYLVIYCDQNKQTMIDAMKVAFRDTIKPVPKKAFEDPSVMLQWLSGNYVSPQDTSEMLEEAQPPYETMELEQTELDKLHKLEKELTDSLQTPPDSQERMMWNNSRPDLQRALERNELRQVDEKAWNFEANSVDHLLEAIGHIEKAMFSKVDYKAALATTLAMKRLFLESKVQRIRLLAQETAMDLLCKICLRGNVALKQASATRPGAAPPDGAQDPEDGDLLAREDEDEAMGEEEDDEDL
ncbi:uncharacterized protein [Littorina saxatilis]|uniref:Uncharacterized protein n=1 Tax=Littorina saxatilis TaxID=31220 RepID=A0AAN9C1A4_9CAEN